MAKLDRNMQKVLTQIRKLPEPYNSMGERLHEVIMQNAPELEPTWRWGLAFYMKDGKDICYIKKAEGCMTFGFSELANLSADVETPNLLPCAWNFLTLDEATEKRIAAMVQRAVTSPDKT